MKTILVLSRQYYDGSGYRVLKAYSLEKRREAEIDKELNEDHSGEHIYRITEIPFSE